MARSMAPLPHPMTSDRERRRPWAMLVLGAGLGSGLHLGLLHFFILRSWSAFWVFMVGALVFATATWVLIRWVFPRFDGFPLASQIVGQGAVALALFIPVSVLFTDAMARWLGGPGLFGTPTGAVETLTITPESRQAMARVYAMLPILPTALMAMLGYHIVWRQVQRMRERERELTELAATAQLAALRAQINPHFLFNSLNSIAQLIHADPDKAEACVERLAQMFRYILHRAEQEFVPLAEELEMTQAYLDIERARFDERLRVETRIDPASLSHPIPNCLLQPLVENAIKHGLSRKLGPGTVSIDAEVRDGRLELIVGDDGLGMTSSALHDVWQRGVGLRNLRERIERLYGTAHLPEITSAPGRGTTVRVVLPAAPDEAA